MIATEAAVTEQNEEAGIGSARELLDEGEDSLNLDLNQIKDPKLRVSSLELGDDTFAFTFISYLRTNVVKYKITRRKQAAIFHRLLVIWGFQVALIYLIYHEILVNELKGTPFTIQVPDYQTFLA